MATLLARYRTLFITLAILSSIILYIIYQLLNVPPRLPVIQPENVMNKELVDTSLLYVKKFHKIAPFSLTNQNGKTITQEDYKDKIYVADFFFTVCQGICPIMTEHMLEIQKEIQNDPEVQLLSHSVTPDYDTPEVLKAYALKKGVDDSKWNLVTGSREAIYTLARKSYLAVEDLPGTEDDLDMVHTENFLLIDKKKQIRGYYDGTVDEDIRRLLGDIEILKAEYAPKESFWEKLF